MRAFVVLGDPHWELIDGGFKVKYITGLNSSTLYKLTLEVNGA